MRVRRSVIDTNLTPGYHQQIQIVDNIYDNSTQYSLLTFHHPPRANILIRYVLSLESQVLIDVICTALMKLLDCRANDIHKTLQTTFVAHRPGSAYSSSARSIHPSLPFGRDIASHIRSYR